MEINQHATGYNTCRCMEWPVRIFSEPIRIRFPRVPTHIQTKESVLLAGWGSKHSGACRCVKIFGLPPPLGHRTVAETRR